MAEYLDINAKKSHNMAMTYQYSLKSGFESANAVQPNFVTIYDDFHEHTHDCHELIVIAGGRGNHTIGGRCYAIGTGDVFVCDRGTSHGFTSVDHLSMYNVAFDIDMFSRHDLDIVKMEGFHALFVMEAGYRPQYDFASYVHLNVQNMGRVFDLLQTMTAEYASKDQGYETLVMGPFIHLSVLLSRAYEHDAPNSKIHRLAPAVAYIHQHYMQPMTAEDIASQAGFSIRHCNRLFHEVMGMSPNRYLMTVRLKRSRELLLSSMISVTEAAQHVGYSDSNYFIRQFRDYYGLTPGQLRKQAKVNEVPIRAIIDIK